MAKAKQQRDYRELAHYVTLLRQNLPALRDHYGVRFMGVFGSYVRGEQRRGSDLDLLVEFDDRPLTLLQFIALEHYLSDLLGVSAAAPPHMWKEQGQPACVVLSSWADRGSS